MDSLNRLRKVVKDVLSTYVDVRYANGDIKNEAVFDETNDRYLVVSVGWDRPYRIHRCLLHLDIIDDKIWIQTDNTEEGVAGDLEEAGVQKSQIVLAFYVPEMRKHTEYAAA